MTRTASSAPIVHAAWPALTAPTPGLRTRVGAVLARRLFCHTMARLPVRVHLVEGDGVRTIGTGGADAPQMTVHRPAELFARLGADASIGLGEAYLTGAWDADDLAAFLTVPARRLAATRPRGLQRLRRLVFPTIAPNDTGEASDTRANIAHHYDLSNDLFELFLDPTMTYSAAWFPSRDAGPAEPGALPAGAPVHGADLVTAQHRKIDALLDLAGVGPGTRLLEIGTGWGELALRAAERGATVRSVTLSVEQQRYATERIAAAGWADAVQIDLIDYRRIEGEYDAVVSVEMIEAVGWRHWSTYFATIESVLAPGGRVAIQAITMPHAWMHATRDEATWITKYIFPGGFLPSVEALTEAAAAGGLGLEVTASLGLHYEETLRQWDERFAAETERLERLGFDATFRRLWHYYLSYSRAGFASGYLDDVHLLLRREG
ncbi:class I SAM-dependent methyltransferase [Nocardioides sp.]|uniref:class I SAM-dependent methyltransferase n=1 Tax=Nocardioides sp. TaxID=35761 RepID=UPI00261B9F72|nr:class I SAM-dependent methyltransferase [Nocardioides sp.]